MLSGRSAGPGTFPESVGCSAPGSAGLAASFRTAGRGSFSCFGPVCSVAVTTGTRRARKASGAAGPASEPVPRELAALRTRTVRLVGDPGSTGWAVGWDSVAGVPIPGVPVSGPAGRVELCGDVPAPRGWGESPGPASALGGGTGGIFSTCAAALSRAGRALSRSGPVACFASARFDSAPGPAGPNPGTLADGDDSSAQTGPSSESESESGLGASGSTRPDPRGGSDRTGMSVSSEDRPAAVSASAACPGSGSAASGNPLSVADRTGAVVFAGGACTIAASTDASAASKWAVRDRAVPASSSSAGSSTAVAKSCGNPVRPCVLPSGPGFVAAGRDASDGSGAAGTGADSSGANAVTHPELQIEVQTGGVVFSVAYRTRRQNFAARERERGTKLAAQGPAEIHIGFDCSNLRHLSPFPRLARRVHSYPAPWML